MPIDEKILSIDADDDDGVDIKTFTKFVEEDTRRKKEKFARDFDEAGEIMLAEIEQKKQLKEKQKIKYVKYILRHSKVYIKSQLITYSLEDVKNIYEEIRNKRPLHKAFRFIFNL
jgi:hypothetical protein